MHRVAVTGIGVICALGRTAEEFGRSLREGRPGIGPIRSADVSTLRFQNGAEVPAYDHGPYFDDKRADFICLNPHFHRQLYDVRPRKNRHPRHAPSSFL